MGGGEALSFDKEMSSIYLLCCLAAVFCSFASTAAVDSRKRPLYGSNKYLPLGLKNWAFTWKIVFSSY